MEGGEIMSWGWKYNLRRKKCPVCGGKGRHFATPSEAPHMGWCWEAPSIPLRGWKPTRNPHLFLNEGDAPETPCVEVQEKAQRELAPPPLRNAIYRELLRKLNLSGSHRRHILERGFTEAQIDHIPFATLQKGKRYGIVKEVAAYFPEGSLDGMPGFFINRGKNDTERKWWTLGGSPGLLIPVMDINQHLIAFQIRPDYSEKAQKKAKKKGRNLPKYLWLSSQKKEGGVGSGSPAGVLYPKGTNKHTKFKRVFYTEGFFKALAIMFYFNAPVVWISGVHQWKNALEPLSQLNAEEILITFDSDFHDNPHVQAALLQSVNALGSFLDDTIVKAVQWDPSRGKGIDDALLQGGLTFDELQPLDLDQILSSLRPPGQLPNSKYLRMNPENKMDPPEQEKCPDKEACWKATEKAVEEALHSQPGTISIINAGTGYGKSTALTKHIQPKTLVVSRDYDDTGEQIRTNLLSQGICAEWIYGRQSEKVEEDAPLSKQERVRIANCKDLLRAIQAIQGNHNACLDCSYCPHSMEDGSVYYSCGYRRHRDELQEDFPLYGLAVPKVAMQPTILNKFETIVFDDIPTLLQHIADERVLTLGDIATWQGNRFDKLPWQVRQFISALRSELATCNKTPTEPSKELRVLAEQAIKSIKRKKSILPCEESFLGERGKIEYPKAWVRETLASFADGMPVELTAENVTFWTGRPDLLRIFQQKRIIILDATADLTIYKGLFGKSLLYLLNIPELPKNQPRIVQVPDILGSKEQIQRLHKHILNLAQREDAFILTRAGECTNQLHADGWLGRHERALNTLQDRGAGILAGHFSLPPEATRKMAQGIRAIARQLNVPDPEVPEMERDEKGRGWAPYYDKSRRYKGLERNITIHKDPLAEHIGRHFHTSTVIQAWGRHRGSKILYLIDGKPLYSPNEPIWVTMMTLRELGLEPIEMRGNHEKFQKANEVRAAKRQARVEKGIKEFKRWVAVHKEVPSVRSLRKSLGVDGRLCKVEVAKDVQEGLQVILDEIVQEKQETTGLKGGVPHRTLKEFITSVGYTLGQSDNSLKEKKNSRLFRENKQSLPDENGFPQVNPPDSTHQNQHRENASDQVITDDSFHERSRVEALGSFEIFSPFQIEQEFTLDDLLEGYEVEYQQMERAARLLGEYWIEQEREDSEPSYSLNLEEKCEKGGEPRWPVVRFTQWLQNHLPHYPSSKARRLWGELEEIPT